MVPDTRYAILGLLARKPDHGYELARRFGELFGPGWEINRGQVYDVLDHLREAGWAECLPSRRGGRELKVYTVTQKGDQALCEWRARPCAGSQLQREAFYLKLALATPQDAPYLLEDIALREQDCVDLLRRYAESASPVPEGADEWDVLARATINHATTTRLHGDLDWLSTARKRIERFVEHFQCGTAVTDDESSSAGPSGASA